MNIGKITALNRKALREAQKEVNRIYSKYSKLINEEIANQLPKGSYLKSGNGMCIIFNENDEEIADGKAWGIRGGSSVKLDKLAELQYGTSNDELQGNYWLDDTIHSNQK